MDRIQYILKNLKKIYKEVDTDFSYKGWKWTDCIYHIIPMSLKNVEKEKKYIGDFNFEKSVIVFKSTKEKLNFNWIIEVDDIKRYDVIIAEYLNKKWACLVVHLDKGKRMIKILLDPKQAFTFFSAFRAWIKNNVEKFRGILLS